MAGAFLAALAAAAVAAALAAAPAHAAVEDAAMEDHTYGAQDRMVFVGTAGGNASVNVAIKGASGGPTQLFSDPLLGAGGEFRIATDPVEDVFPRAGRYNATAFASDQSPASGVTIGIRYDGSSAVLVPDYSVELRQVGDMEAAEGEELSFTARIGDASLDGVEYSLAGNPAGASIGASSGRFSWTPSETQGHARGLDYTFDIVASKGPLEDRETVRIEVFEQAAPEPEDPAPAPAPRAEPDAAPTSPAPFVDDAKDPQSYVDRYLEEESYREWFARNYPEYGSIYEAVGLDEPLQVPAPFVDDAKDPQSYVDRYLAEESYREWFARNYPEYGSIYEAVGLDEPPELAPFVDPDLDPEHYVARYESEPSYRSWFDSNFPGMTIHEAVGLDEPEAPEPEIGECGEGTRLVDGRCEVAEAGGGCLIATAAYGTELAPHVQALRELRDGAAREGAGAAAAGALHAAYYSFSPAVADLERGHPELRPAVRALVSPAAHALSAAAGG